MEPDRKLWGELQRAPGSGPGVLACMDGFLVASLGEARAGAIYANIAGCRTSAGWRSLSCLPMAVRSRWRRIEADGCRRNRRWGAVTSRLSRRSLFTGLTSASGLIGCYSAAEARERHASGLVLRLSPPRIVDLNSTAEQAIDIAHEGSARPSAEKVVLVDVIQDQPAVDTSALRWAAGYPIYDEAASTSRMARVLLRFAVPAGVPVTGRARILFEVPAGTAGTSL